MVESELEEVRRGTLHILELNMVHWVRSAAKALDSGLKDEAEIFGQEAEKKAEKLRKNGIDPLGIARELLRQK